MTESEYIEQRVDDQIKWLSGKSGSNQQRFKRLRLAEIALASLIPVAVALPVGESWAKAFVAIAGAAIAIITAAVSIWKLQENWVQYRATAESLRRERFLFLTQAAPYQGTDRFPLFVSRVEALLGAENAKWIEQTSAQLPAGQAGGGPPAGAAGAAVP
jgi:hypothetical protein